MVTSCRDRVTLGLLLLVLMLPGSAAALTVATDVERDTVTAGDTVVVTFEVDEKVSSPDFTPLKNDFEILNRSSRQSLSVGATEDGFRMAWTLVLMPRRSGELTLPAIRFGAAESDPAAITVVDTPGLRGADVYAEYSVDDPTPHVNQQVLLTTQVYSAVDVEDLEVSVPGIVRGDASLDRLGGSRDYQSVRGGRRYAVREQRYTLVPAAAGALVLAPIEASASIGGRSVKVQSERLELEVIDAAAQGPEGLQLKPDNLFIELEVDKRSPYVQEQVLYTVRLFRSVPIENANLSSPSVSGGDALIERVERDRRYQAMRDERPYAVVERRFALFPQTAGTLTLEPVQLRAAVPLPSGGSNTSGFWTRPLTTSVRIESGSVDLEVRPPPEDAPRPWLPARRLRIEEQWPDEKTVEVGTPVSRRVVLEAEGLLASQLPDLNFGWPDELKSYPEQPTRANESSEQGVDARLQQNIALIPVSPGTITIPAFELGWWNTTTDRRETVQLAARTLEVVGGAASQAADGGESSRVAPDEAPGVGAGWWLSLFLGLGWLATLILWLRDRRRVPRRRGVEVPAEPDVSRRQAEPRLKEACRSGDAEAARDSLLVWGGVLWPEQTPRSLGAVGRLAGGEIAVEISMLQNALYAPGRDPWNGDALYRAVAGFRPASGPRGTAASGSLKPLYER